MSVKKFYWLKLDNDFWNSFAVGMMATKTGVARSEIIYLKMLTASLHSQNSIEFENLETLHEEIAYRIREDEMDVNAVLEYLIAKKKAVVNENCIIFEDAERMTGSESDSAERVRKCREKKGKNVESVEKTLQCNGKALQCNTERYNVTECNADVTENVTSVLQCNDREDKRRKEESREEQTRQEQTAETFVPQSQKRSYGAANNVILTDAEYNNLCVEFGESVVREAINEYGAWIQTRAITPQRNQYGTLRKWIARKSDSYSGSGSQGDRGVSENIVEESYFARQKAKVESRENFVRWLVQPDEKYPNAYWLTTDGYVYDASLAEGYRSGSMGRLEYNQQTIENELRRRSAEK